jgi:hypothetical protein
MTDGFLDVRYVGLLQAARRLNLSEASLLRAVEDPIVRENIRRLKAAINAFDSARAAPADAHTKDPDGQPGAPGSKGASGSASVLTMSSAEGD